MIELSATTALMLYLGATLLCLLGIWIFYHYGTRKKCFLPPEKHFYVCEFCHFTYLDQETKKITRCPRCQSYNA